MSPRQSVDQQRIEYFLRQLGKNFSKPGRVYLVGGTSMVYEGLRQQTLDIDLTFEIANEYHNLFIEVIRDLKERLSLNIEEVSPADFIPLPAGYKERSQFINRYGQLDVFHFDLYSTSLSKIARGTAEDFADVLSLIKTDQLEMEKLTQYFNEILPHFATTTLKRDPTEFKRKFQILTQMWSDTKK
jgi:hypothetical protein